jgi:hypothetical protein
LSGATYSSRNTSPGWVCSRGNGASLMIVYDRQNGRCGLEIQAMLPFLAFLLMKGVANFCKVFENFLSSTERFFG